MTAQGLVMRSSAIVTLLALLAADPAHARDASELVDAKTVIEQIKQSSAMSAPAGANAGQLLVEIKRFRGTSAESDPRDAAVTWFQLYDRAVRTQAGPSDLTAYDVDLQSIVGVRSVIAALPAPPAWPHLRDHARERALRYGGDYRELTLQLLVALLLNDHASTEAHLKSIDTAIAALPPDQRLGLQREVANLRVSLRRLYGEPAEVAQAFLTEVSQAADDAIANMGFVRDVEVPDLVTLVGDDKAAVMLKEALVHPVSLYVRSGDATRALARRVALENVEQLKVPQWALVDSIEAAAFYEALLRRFSAGSAAQDSEGAIPSRNYYKDQAGTYYLLALIINGKQAEAQGMLQSIAGTQRLTIPKPAIQALQKAQQNDALYAFLAGVLVEHPDVQAWDVFIEQAAYTGQGREALATLDKVLKRTDLPSYVRADLQRRRADALLALDEVQGALKTFADLLRASPSTTDPYIEQRAQAALRLAGIGRVLHRAEAADNGLRFIQETLALHKEGSAQSLDRRELLRSFFAESRKQHREADAQRLAIAELKRPDPDADPMAEQLGMSSASPMRRAALIELVSLYAAANRPADVRTLLDESEYWGAADLRHLLYEKDSLGVPFTLGAARALAATGEHDAAVRVATATIAQFPGHDGAYELESSIDARAIEVFDAQYRSDQFEERPLIWKAVVLARSTKLAEAEQSIRAAIAIDPSDGEEGVNDRMRAYAVLADIRDAAGDPQAAREYREAVTAIRISERSDELYALGLYSRAFAGYREALGHFADAYCIQSRLAVQLNQQGHHEQAAEHYRRAYELMPASFGRVESHCFGCENVFEGARSQGIAEEVFQSLARRDASNPRVHYLLGYLYQEQGRYPDALSAFREAVRIDGSYLNAWRHLNELSSHIYLNAVDRDVITVKLLELDPEQRHVTYDTANVGDFEVLWNTVARLNNAPSAPTNGVSLYRLKESARLYEQKQAELPEEMRIQIQQYRTLLEEVQPRHRLESPPLVLGTHRLLLVTAGLLGDDNEGYME